MRLARWDIDDSASITAKTSLQQTPKPSPTVVEPTPRPAPSPQPVEPAPVQRGLANEAETPMGDDFANAFASTQRVEVDEKAMINCRADLNQLIPFKYVWAWEKYLLARKNHWMPDEIPMQDDITQWRSEGILSDDERKVVKRSLGFFATADSLVANNIVLGVYRLITNPECRNYLLLQASEEALHTHAYQYCIESLGMDESELFNMYREIPSVGDKSAWALKQTSILSDPHFTTGTLTADRKLLENLIAYYCVVEGIFFYCGFALILSMAREGKMVNTAKQFEMIMRDESMHINFGLDMINQIKQENPYLWDAEMQETTIKMIKEGLDLEVAYARDTMPSGIQGMNVELMTEYLQYIANRRFTSLQLPEQYDAPNNPFPWMTRTIDQQKQVAFFEQNVADYQIGGGIQWDKGDW
ncbi:MAG: ribonucleotide-diphosphate reductase subunit beta [Gammaproteobacteria bacterium]|nr:ribonucleotide-diphosphate reductase subunit beta [Gammaproteobacteria bacterium]